MAGAVSSSSLTVNSNNISAVNSLGFRNRIINGDMRIDQRNNGASVTATNSYAVDRFKTELAVSTGTFTMQQSSVAPTGFSKSFSFTTNTVNTGLASGDRVVIMQSVEGNNIADLGFGIAGASPITLSFWVRSSVTGTFGGSLRNGNATRSYPFAYTINVANTWEYKTITAVGETTGTWTTDNSIGIGIIFSLGAGSLFPGTAGSWASANNLTSTGASNAVITTAGATFYITGVQLEAGSVATPFERRDYGRELIMCQRYAWSLRGNGQFICNAFMRSTTGGIGVIQFPVTMRATAALTVPNVAGYFNMSHGNQDNASPTISIPGGGTQITENNASLFLTFASGSSTIGWGGCFATNNASSFVLFTAEL
jgi:hypothetical protein